MKNLDFEWLTDEFMLYCRSTQLREKTMSSYEQTLHLFGRWLSDELKIYTVDKITENVIRKYIDDLMVRGKYTLLLFLFFHARQLFFESYVLIQRLQVYRKNLQGGFFVFWITGIQPFP